jgi:hypothetical protein
MSRGYQPHIYRGRCGGPHFSKALWDWILGPRRSTGHGYSGKGVLLVMMFNFDMMYYFLKTMERSWLLASDLPQQATSTHRGYCVCFAGWTYPYGCGAPQFVRPRAVDWILRPRRSTAHCYSIALARPHHIPLMASATMARSTITPSTNLPETIYFKHVHPQTATPQGKARQHNLDTPRRLVRQKHPTALKFQSYQYATCSTRQ